ncbi:MAG: YibE/F family protein [Treponema sp.]|nr:YibE/F family protein [Treponema sp.]
MIRISIPYLITIAAAVALLIIGHNTMTPGMINFQNTPNEVAKAKVERVIEKIEANYDFLDDFDEEYETVPMTGGRKIIFEAKVLDGMRKGQTITAEQTFSPLLIDRSKEIEKGNKVILFHNEIGWFFGGYLRTNKLLGLGIIFIFCVLLFGGKKGFNTIVSLTFTCSAIFAVFIPAILSGKNIYIMSILVCVFTIIMVPLIVIGYNKKSLASILGCVAGVMVAGIIALVMDKLLFFTGITDEHSRYLVNLPGDIQLDLKAIIFAGIIIGAMGAVMDVSISISSSLWEIKEKAENIKFKELLKSGITIGRDIMGTMADTLILAYIGCSLTVVILLSIYSGSLFGLFNSEMIAVEILQALAGSFGILFAMPLTALFSAFIYLGKPRGDSGSVSQDQN